MPIVSTSGQVVYPSSSIPPNVYGGSTPFLSDSQTTVAGIPPGVFNGSTPFLPATTTNTTPSSADTELPSYQFIAGWILLFVILTFVNKTRLGHVVIYYSLLLIILLILVTEYQQIVPILNSIQTIGMFNTKKAV